MGFRGFHKKEIVDMAESRVYVETTPINGEMSEEASEGSVVIIDESVPLAGEKEEVTESKEVNVELIGTEERIVDEPTPLAGPHFSISLLWGVLIILLFGMVIVIAYDRHQRSTIKEPEKVNKKLIKKQ